MTSAIPARDDDPADRAGVIQDEKYIQPMTLFSVYMPSQIPPEPIALPSGCRTFVIACVGETPGDLGAAIC